MDIAEIHDTIITYTVTSATARDDGGLDLKMDENYMYVFDLQLSVNNLSYNLSCLVVL